MKRVVVTGATSMIGIALIEECIKNNVQVTALVRRHSHNLDRLPQNDLVVCEDCDLEEMRSFKSEAQGFDAFYHFAWGYTDKAGRMSSELQQKNIQYSLDAIDLAVRLRCKKFIGAGSQAEYGMHVDDKTRPDSIATPINPYGICKYTAGKLCSISAQQRGIDFFWVRIFSIYGKYDQPDTMVSSTIRKMMNGERCSFTLATQIWDYLYSEDAGRAFYLIGEKSVGNKVYCLGSGEKKPLREYIEILRDVINPGASLRFGELSYTNSIPNGMCADISQLHKDTEWLATTEFGRGIMNLFKQQRNE